MTRVDRQTMIRTAIAATGCYCGCVCAFPRIIVMVCTLALAWAATQAGWRRLRSRLSPCPCSYRAMLVAYARGSLGVYPHLHGYVNTHYDDSRPAHGIVPVHGYAPPE